MNALIIDAALGVVKADIGIKGGMIVGVGKAGNPDVMDGVTPGTAPASPARPGCSPVRPGCSLMWSRLQVAGLCAHAATLCTAGMVTGVTTEAIAGEKMIVTAGGVDTHVHYICPQLLPEALASGVTTLYGGGTGPASGTCATTCTPAPDQVKMMLQATDCFPMNIGLSGKGNTSTPEGMHETLAAGAAGFKLHEDWGTTPAAIDACLDFADAHDVAVTIHTDTLNESGYVGDSLAAIKGRTIHTYHSEGAGGGHAPDIIKVCRRGGVAV